MSEISKYEEYKNKLQGVCDANNLVFSIKKETYPLVLVVRPSNGVGEQMSMLEDADVKGYRSPDSYLAFFYDEDGGVQIDPSGKFQLSDALFGKIKNLFKKLCFFWLQFFFRDVIEKDSLKRGMMPVINEDEASDSEEAPDTDDGDDEAADGEPEDEDEEDGEKGGDEDADDALIGEATQIVRVENKASTSLLQRRLNIGYSKAARILDRLEELGVVGPFNGSDPREVLPFDIPEDEAV